MSLQSVLARIKIWDGTTTVSVTGSSALKVDNSAVTQPVSGTVTANAGTNLNTSLLALESGGNLATVAGAIRAEDAASADAHTGVGALAVRKATPANTSGTDGDYEFLQMSAGRLWASATIDAALPAGTAAIGKLAANDGVDIGDVTINNASGASAVNIQDGGNSITVDGTVAVTLAAGVAAIAKAEDVASNDADVGVPALAVRKATPANTSGTDGDYEFLQMAAGRLWVDASGKTLTVDGTATVQPVKITCGTGTQSSVAGSATSVSLLASNANRRGATVYNDSTAILYLKLGATASTTSFTTKLYAEDYYEVPGVYTGAIDGIWASATGNARITELT